MQTLRDQLWEARLTADFEARYYTAKAAALTRRERGLTIASALLSSATFAAVLLNATGLDLLVKISACVAAISTAALAFKKQGAHAKLAADQAALAATAHRTLCDLWAQQSDIDADALRNRMIAARESCAINDAALIRELPLDTALQQRAFSETLTANGLAPP
jgi:hypothetical protein